MKNKYLYFILLGFFSINVFGQGNTAPGMQAFCAGGSSLTFNNTTNSPGAAAGSAQNYGCLGSQPNPAWFYMQVGNAGTLSFFMSQTSNNGTPIDVDFIAWGPFAGPPPIYGPSNLNSNTQVGCSFSAAATESFSINNAPAGSYYVVLITNYSNQAGQITLTQTNAGQPGAGSTNCDIVCPLSLGGDFELCPGQTSVLTATIANAASYQWFNGTTPIPGNTQSITISGPGQYKVVVNKQGCVANATATVNVTLPTPIASAAPSDLYVCVVPSVTPHWNLTQNTNQVRNGLDPDYFVVSYHTTQNDAEQGFNAISNANASNYAGTNGQTIYVRVEDYNTGCYRVYTFHLYSNSGPAANTLTDLKVCDDDSNNGTEIFDLTVQNAAALGSLNATQYNVKYFTSLANANANTNAIAAPQTFTGGNQPIYVRVTSVDDANCFSVTSFNLVVNPKPVVTDPADVTVCANTGYTLPALTVGNYYTAAAGGGTQIPAGTLITSSQTIYVFAQSNTTPNCTDEENFTVTVVPMPVADDPADVSACDSYTLPALTSGSYYTGTGGTGTMLPAGTAITTTQDIYVYAQSGTTPNCTDEKVFTVTINPTPVLGTATPVALCDDDTDGSAVFNLTASVAQIVNGLTGMDATLHNSQADADAGVNPQNIAAYTGTTQTVYVRVVQQGTTTNCYSVGTISLTVHPLPVADDPADVFACDSYTLPALTTGSYYTGTGGTGTMLPSGTAITTTQDIYVYAQSGTTPNCTDENVFTVTINQTPVLGAATPVVVCDDNADGAVVFNLTASVAQVVNGLTGMDATLHNSQADANAGINPQNIAAYTGTTQTVYVRVVQQGTTTNCYATAPVSLTVNPKPVVGTITDYIQCDVNSSPDGVEVFDLTTKAAEALNGATGTAVTYYTSQADAEAGTNAIANPSAYSSGTAVIWVRLVDGNGCYGTGSFNVIVNPLPVINQSTTPYHVCEVSAGEAGFDLTTQNAQIDATGAYTIRYYETLADAQAGGTNDIQGLYTSPSTTVYVRADNPGTGCWNTTTLSLVADPLPTPGATTPLVLCDDNNDGTATFDLTPAGAEAANGASGMLVTYHQSQADADSGSNVIGGASAYNSATGTVYIRVQDGATGCYATTTVSLTVNPRPVAGTIADYVQCDVNSSPDGVEVFDLTTKDAEALNGATGTTVTYYTSQGDAEAGTSAIANPSAHSSGTAVIWVRLADGNGCYGVGSFNVIVNPLPVLNQSAAPYSVCEAGAGEGAFDLPTQNAQMDATGTYVIRYYETLADAQAGGTNDIQGLYTSPSTTVYVRGEDPATGCWNTAPLSLVVVPLPTPGATTPLVMCDDNNDGYASFNLNPAGTEAVNGQPGLLVTYHETLLGAQGAGIPIANPSAHNAITGTVYIRLEDAASGCYAVTSVTLTVNPRPVAGTITPYELCDDTTADGFRPFDLTTKQAEILNGATGTVTYYTSQADADAATNAIANPASYVNTTAFNQTIWVRITDGNSCYGTGSFSLVVDPLPTINTSMSPFYACENAPGQGLFDLSQMDTVVTNGAAGYAVMYYENLADAQAGNTNYLPMQYLSGSRTIYIRVSDAVTGCWATTPLSLQVIPGPVAPALAPLNECDFNNDGVAPFNLLPVVAQLQATMGNVTVTIYETPEDAEFSANPIPTSAWGSYTNVNVTTGVPKIYFRIQSNLTACYDVAELQLIVHPVPVAVEPQDYEVCDDNTDGSAIFDLTTRNAEVLGTMNPADYTVTYHTQQAYAQAGSPAIPNPAAYPSQSATIWVRVTENTTGCYDIVELKLVVNPLPAVNNPTPYTLCDVNNPGDEREVFDLTTKVDEITGGAFGVNAAFYHSYADAQAGVNAITNPEAYTNTATVETLFVRVSNAATGCFRIVLLDVRVEPLPTVDIAGLDPDDVTECDMDGDGFAQFDLQAIVQGLINNGQNLVVSFHETAQDAQNNLNPIANPASYTNINPLTQTIYVRVENTVTGCTNSQDIPITLVVQPAPQVPDLEDITLCDDTDTNNQNAQTAVNLTVQTTVIEAAIGTGNTIHYFTSEVAANNGAPRITNPGAYNASNGQTIWVRVEDANGCYGVESFKVIINTPLALTTPTPLALCNEALPNDNTTVFDLTTKDNQILGPAGIGAGYTVAYYEVNPRTNTGATPIANPESYTNPVNPKTLFVVVTSPEGCKSYTTLTIKVLPLPTPRMNPDALELCDYTGNAGEETFDLTLAAQQIRNNDSFAQLSYYTSQGDAELGVNAIATPTAWTSVTATIYVRVEAGDSNPQNPRCAVIVPLQIIVNPLPVLGDGTQIRPYAICEPATDGFATFLLNSRIGDILMTQNPADYNVKFFRDLTTAQNNTNALPNQYVNQVMGHQVIYVRVQNLTTDCITIMPWDLYVELEAVANAAGNLATCDDDGNNDGLHLFDLTTQDATILGGQPQGPGQYIVEYYETDPQTDPTATPIATPAAWTNTTPDAQTVYVRVYNDGTISKCSDYTAFNVEVNRLPEPVLAPGTICVEYGTNTVIRTYILDPQIPGGDVALGYQYTWYKDGVALNDPVADPSSNTATYEASAAGDYTVSVVSPAGCTSDPIAAVTVSQSGPAVAVGVGYEVSNAFSADQTITITVAGYGVYEYRLDYGPWQTSNIFTDVPRGSHTVYVRDVSTDDPCDDAGMILELEDISIIDYPKFFTPNADGHNDTWNITGLGGQLDAKIYIFDRYGKLLKQISSSNESQGWDGTYNGAPLIADDYWFTVTYREMVNGVEVTKEFKSHFSLKR